MRRIALIGALIAACGGDGGGDSIEGTWSVYSDGCLFSVDFRDGRAAWGTQCELEDGSVGVEAERGTYEFEGDVLVTRTLESTCPPEPDDYETERADYVVDGDTLTLFFDEGAITLERVENDDPSAGVWAYGCFDGDVFRPGKLRKL